MLHDTEQLLTGFQSKRKSSIVNIQVLHVQKTTTTTTTTTNKQTHTHTGIRP